jgi:hypothetical protein
MYHVDGQPARRLILAFETSMAHISWDLRKCEEQVAAEHMDLVLKSVTIT